MRLIDADELIEHAWRDKLDSRELIEKMINNAPTVKEISIKIPIDVFEKLISQEPKTGHWKPYGYPWVDKFMCSECGKEQPKILCGERIIGHWSDYCPNCGCRMFEPQESEDNNADSNW